MSRLRQDSHYPTDIQEAIQHMLEYTRNSPYEGFLEHRIVRDAALWDFQVIGEATKGLSDTLRIGNSQIPWRGMAGLQDRIVHDYFGIS